MSTQQRTKRTRRFASSSVLVALASLFAANSHAELKLLDEKALSKVSAKAGLTIDIETRTTIAEIEYVDAGSIFTKDYSLSGIGGGLMDNIRATVDISNGTGETLATGFSDFALAASLGYLDSNDSEVAWAIAEYDDGNGRYGKQDYQDGDLVIHVGSTDFGGLDPADLVNPQDFSANLDNMKNAVDFHLQRGEYGLRSSDGLTETVLSNSWSAEAYLGYLDLHITNRGNGFTKTDGTPGKPQGVYLADSYMGMDVKFRIEDLDINKTENASNTFVPRAVTNPNLVINDMRIHNERGADTEGSFGYASIEQKTGAVIGVAQDYDDMLARGEVDFDIDGMAVYDINVVWDWDVTHISFGEDRQSIGSVYLTDFHITDTSLVISAH